jgi:putative sigma-54 modulation protein
MGNSAVQGTIIIIEDFIGGYLMEMHITGKNIELIPAVRDYISKKMGKINRHLPDIISFDLVASEEKTRAPDQRYIVQVTLDSKGTLIRGEERGQDLYTATDKVYEVMMRQIEHYKGKLPYAKGRRPTSIRTSTTEATSNVEAETEPEGPRIVKTKRFDVKPMSMEEAVDQMELLGHDFFLFFNPDANRINLLYRRKDGDYGLIEPIMK